MKFGICLAILHEQTNEILGYTNSEPTMNIKTLRKDFRKLYSRFKKEVKQLNNETPNNARKP